MTIKHIQARVGEEEFKQIKKKAIDLGLTVEEFLRQSALEKVEESKRKEAESGESVQEGGLQSN